MYPTPKCVARKFPQIGDKKIVVVQISWKKTEKIYIEKNF